MDNKKIYARQIAPEMQESPMYPYTDESFGADIIIAGNRGFAEHTTREYDNVVGHYDNVLYGWNNRHNHYTNDDEVWPEDEMLIDILKFFGFYPGGTACSGNYPPVGWWTPELLQHWRELFESDLEPGDDEFILYAMRLVTGRKWAVKTIRGNMQSEWQCVYYSIDDWSSEAIKELEIEYFNLGTEWMIHDEPNVPTTPDDIIGYSVYCYGCSYDEICGEIAKRAEGKPEDVVMYAFDGYWRIATYKEV